MQSFRFIRPIGFLALALTVASPALGFDDKPTPPPTREPRVPPAGGAGKNNGERGVERGRGAENGRPGARAGGFEMWIAAVKRLDLSADQKSKIDAVVAEFEKKNEEWKTANAEKVKALEEKAKSERKEGKEATEETRKAIRELNESRPKPPEYQKKVEDVLTEAQRTQLKANLDKAREEQKKNRDEARKGREKGGEDAPKREGPGGGNGGGTGGGKEGGNGRSR